MRRAESALVLVAATGGMVIGAAGCRSSEEAMSLLGRALFAPPLSEATRAKYEENLEEARRAFAMGGDVDGGRADLIWYGRRLAYLGRYRDAMDVYSLGLAAYPDDYRVLRHRGHRYITIRRFDDAILDLERAARLCDGRPDEVEEDGLPNAANIPTSTTQTNIFYHLGLARYLEGDYAGAAMAYRRCLSLCTNDDMRVATAYWLYLSLRRTGSAADSEEVERLLSTIAAEMNLIENHAYHRLLLFFRGERTEEEILRAGVEHGSAAERAWVSDATILYGVGAKHLIDGEKERAVEVFRSIVEGMPDTWPAFGHIAAEAELAGESGSQGRVVGGVERRP